MKRGTFPALTVLVCWLPVSLVWASTEADRRRPQEPAAPATAAMGLAVYESRKCATCHMIAGKGNIRFPLDGVAGKLSEADLRRWLVETLEMEGALPRQPAVRMSEWMESNRRLSDADVASLMAYLLTLK